MSPAISLVIPFLDEEDNVGVLARAYSEAFSAAGLDHELILVDNGSRDRTGSLIDELASADPRIRKVVVERNEGYGHGILRGLSEARGRYVGFMCGDLQVDAADVVRVLREAGAGDFDLVKAARVKRHDGLKRRLFSAALNVTVPLLFRTRGRDVNGTPKVMTRDLLRRLRLESKEWFIDAEIMIKASTMGGIRIREIPVVFQARREGRSSVRCLQASLQFLREMARYRLKGLARYRALAAGPAAPSETTR